MEPDRVGHTCRQRFLRTGSRIFTVGIIGASLYTLTRLGIRDDADLADFLRNGRCYATESLLMPTVLRIGR